MPLPRHSYWVFAGVLAAVALLAAPSRSAAGIAVTVEEVDAAGNVVAGGGQPTFFSPLATGTFTVNALPTPDFRAITVSVNRTTGVASDLNSLTTTVNLRPTGVLTGDHFLRVIVSDDGFLNSNPNGTGQLSDNAGTSAGIRGGTNTAQVQTQLKQVDPVTPDNPTPPRLPGPLTNLGSPTTGSSVTINSANQVTVSPPDQGVTIPVVPGQFGLEQTIFIIARADVTEEGIASNSTLGGTLSSILSSSPAPVPAPAGVALALVGLPLLGLRRALRRKPAAV